MDRLDALIFARTYLEGYFKRHSIGTKEIIYSEWLRGVLSGRQEAINILNEAIEKEHMK
jgi:hypothetical protein